MGAKLSWRTLRLEFDDCFKRTICKTETFHLFREKKVSAHHATYENLIAQFRFFPVKKFISQFIRDLVLYKNRSVCQFLFRTKLNC